MPDLDTVHPSAMTDDQREELRKSDPAAFDEEAGDTGTDDTAEAERLAAEQAEADRVAAEEAAKPKGDDHKPTMIPKARLNEVLQERDAERERAEALAAELAALKQGPAINYDDEIKALDAAWNDDNFDGSHDEYLAKRDGLIAGRAEQNAIARYEQQQADKAAQQAAQAWAAAANAFVDEHPEYQNPAEKADLEAALHGVFAKFPDASDAEKLERAHKIVLALNGKTEPEAPKNPNAGRNKSDAQAASIASSQPPTIKGGQGNRSTVGDEIDFANLKPGQWSKLTPEQKAAALGGADAL